MTVTGILSALLIGLVLGILGRAVLPGRQSIGFIATLVVGVGAAFLGTYVARVFGVENAAPARWDWANLTWDWAELGIQVLCAVVGVAIAAAIANSIVSDSYRERRTARRTRRRSKTKADS
jgi:uncharacterized membrane protein YeaQ/YmgE (transglycosylase-associated protein family)